MHPKTNIPKSTDEQLLLKELCVDGSADREQLLTLLCEQAPPIVSEVPPLPEDLRRRFAEQYGASQAKRVPAASPGVFAEIAAWFKKTFAEHPLAYGGLAAACLVILTMVVNKPIASKPHEMDDPAADVIRGNSTTPVVSATSGLQWYWLGAADDALQVNLAGVLGKEKFTLASSLDDTPLPQAKAAIIAVDPQFGAWLKLAEKEPQAFAAEGQPSSPDWPVSLRKATQAAAAAANAVK